jgi:hypothetical protein
LRLPISDLTLKLKMPLPNAEPLVPLPPRSFLNGFIFKKEVNSLFKIFIILFNIFCCSGGYKLHIFIYKYF